MPAEDGNLQVPPPDGVALYATYCSPCHGERGRGDGPAARFFDPPPRDFDRGAFRLVSTTNGVPSDQDLFEVVAAGIPGTAMLPFAHLPHDDLRAMIGVVRGFHRDGVRERIRDAVDDAQELDLIVGELTTPGPPIPVPPPEEDTIESRNRGLLHFRRLCAACHGPSGRGDAMEPRTTVEGHPIRPRDLTRGVLKGGLERRRLFHRVRAGLPGTPMPATTPDALDDAGVWDLVNYLGALIPSGNQALHDPVAWTIRASRIEGPLPEDATDPRFDAAAEVMVALAPFRWNEATVPTLAVRALHDGHVIALRAVWADATRDVPGGEHLFPPDGLAVRVSFLERPPVLPIPGQPLPLDRALWLAGPMPEAEDAVFDAVLPRFANPDRVCVAPIGPERVGRGAWQSGVWTALMAVAPDKAGAIRSGGTMPLSFAVFDGSLRRGPMPVAFSNWHRLRFE